VNWYQITLALLGGVVGAGILRCLDYVRDSRRLERQYAAAIRLVRDELRHNIGMCHALGALRVASESVEPARDECYLSVRLLLAEMLPRDLRLALAYVYAMVARLSEQGRALLRDEPSATSAVQMLYASTRDKLVSVDQRLGRELARLKHVGKEIEVGPVELAGWPPVDATTADAADSGA